MNKYKFLASIMLFFTSCSTFSELKPEPEIVGEEGQYIELDNSGESFELKNEGKYFIKFPGVKTDNFYLVLKVKGDPNISYYFTDIFDDGKGEKKVLNDFDPDSKGMDLYAISPSRKEYFWVIERVNGDQKLSIEYRYVPIWRYKFENQYKSLKNNLDQNKLKTDLFGDLEKSFNYESYSYSTEISRTEKIDKVFSEVNRALSEISSLIPQGISEADPAYQNYVQIKDELKNEREKLMLYNRFLLFYSKIKSSDNSPLSFINESGFFISFFKDMNRLNYPSSIKKEMQQFTQKRLKDSEDYLTTDFKKKRDLSLIDYKISPLKDLAKLLAYDEREFIKLINFKNDFNAHSKLISESKSSLQNINYELNSKIKWPDDLYYINLSKKLRDLRNRHNALGKNGLNSYSSYSCVRLVESAKRTVVNNLNNKAGEFDQVAEIVKEVNDLKTKKDYRKMIARLLDNRRYPYLAKQYAGVDELSLEKQTKSITNLFNSKNYSEAETAIAGLARDNYFLNPRDVQKKKMAFVMRNEENLYNAVVSESIARANKAVDENYNKWNNTKGIYEGESFKPLHRFTYSHKGQGVIDQRNKGLEAELNKVKTITFPEKSINFLYPLFLKNINDSGVEKAKSIVVHGNYYKGKSASTWYRVNECDPIRSKLLDKTTTYRKVYCIPVNDKKSGENEYIFKIHMKIPTKAKFPVYELNIKLPVEVANDAEFRKWYTSIKMNAKLIKNEGRVSIVSPTKKNNFEAQISPLQVKKTGTNVLEVKFKHPLFTVFELSVMAQKPLIKKN